MNILGSGIAVIVVENMEHLDRLDSICRPNAAKKITIVNIAHLKLDVNRIIENIWNPEDVKNRLK